MFCCEFNGTCAIRSIKNGFGMPSSSIVMVCGCKVEMKGGSRLRGANFLYAPEARWEVLRASVAARGDQFTETMAHGSNIGV